MALFSLPVAEACAIDFVKIYDYAAKFPEWNNRYNTRSWSHEQWNSRRANGFKFKAPITKIAALGGSWSIWLGGTEDELAMLRAALPFGYAIEADGRLWREEHPGFTHRLQLTLDAVIDGATIIDRTGVDEVTHWFSTWVGLASVVSIDLLDDMCSYGRDEPLGPTPLSELVSSLVYNRPNGFVRRDESRKLLHTEKPFLKALAPIPGYKREPLKQATGKSTGRKVVLDLDNDSPAFAPEDFLATRCTGNYGASFVRLGLRWQRHEQKLALGKFEPSEKVSDWNRHQAMLLAHKAADAWRFVAMLPIFYHAQGIHFRRFKMMPCFYLIPVTVSKNEVTFAHATFRGPSLATQQRIWAVDGMSMAINHALMTLNNQIKKMPNPYLIEGSSHAAPIPTNHRVAMLGKGRCGTTGRDEPIRDILADGEAHNDGPWAYPVSARSGTLKITRASDVLDDIFSDLPPNQIVPSGKKTMPKAKLEVARKVRL